MRRMRRRWILGWLSASALLACSLATSLDELGPDAGIEGGVGTDSGAKDSSSTDGSAIVDAAGDGDAKGSIPNLLCGSKQCDAGPTLCCFGQGQAFCTSSCAGPSWAAVCDDSRQCAARYDSGSYDCCLQPLDAGTYVVSLCSKGCLQTVCNPVDPFCPNAQKCTGLQVVEGYSLHFCQ